MSNMSGLGGINEFVKIYERKITKYSVNNKIDSRKHWKYYKVREKLNQLLMIG